MLRRGEGGGCVDLRHGQLRCRYGRRTHDVDDAGCVPGWVGGAEESGDSGGERCGGAGSDGLNVGGVAEVEAAEAVGGVCRWAVGGGGLA